MNSVEAPSYPVSIFMAGDVIDAERVCREYCDEIGFCVTVTQANYIYTRGEEDGFIVGLINYPRFPREPEIIWARAWRLAALLREALNQESYTIQAPDKTVWFSHRDQDNASCGTRPKGGDAHAAPALPSDAVGAAETPSPSPIDPLNVEEGL